MRLRRLLIRLVFVAAIPGALALAYLWRAKDKIAEYQAACEVAYKAKEWETLERAAISWYEWQPEIALPLIYAAQASTERGDLVRASLYLSQLPDDDDESLPGLMELSDLYFGPLNQPLAAAETWKRILKIAPATSEAHRRLVFFYAMARMRDELIREARRGIEVGCDVPETYLYLFGADWMTFTNGAEVNSRWLEGVAHFETFKAARAFHFARTMAMSEQGQEKDADGVNLIESQLAELTGEHPHNKELLAYHLDLATYRGDIANVLILLKQAPADSINDSRFWRYKGWVHNHRGESDEAIKAYQKAVELHPYDGRAHHELAALFRRTNQLDNVGIHQELSKLGGDIMRTSLAIPSTDSLPPELMDQMARYAKVCGDKLVAERLASRVKQRQSTTGRETTLREGIGGQ